MHPSDEMLRILQDIDTLEADARRIQSRLWSIRQSLQKITGKKIGYQYDEELETEGR